MPIRLKYLFLAAAAIFASPALAQQADDASPCEPRTVEGSGYIICRVAPGAGELRLFWKDASGQPFRSFDKLDAAVRAEGRSLVFAINAGMYSDDFTPVGLYIENGQELVPANQRKITGAPASIPNFYKRPNGVFFLDDTGAHILETETYLQQPPRMGEGAVQFATQSGPMLVIEGKLHPALIAGSTDRTRRSGVGVCDKGEVRFAISEDDVNFYDFARLFRDELQCPNALFLDGGNGAGLFDPRLNRADRSWHGGYGPMFGLVR